MCGIAGIVGPKNIVNNTSLINRMTEAIKHRGPDSGGVWNGNGVALGHRRLSIIDLSEGANQPFWDQSKNYCIIFNGEVYNFEEVKNKINNYNFVTECDTEVVLAAYLKWGEKCLNYFNGMFAFAIWDVRNESLFFARDRMGIKPFYYYKENDLFIFSSEIRSMLSSGLIDKKIDDQGLVEYLSYQTVHAPNTIIKNIKQLESGQYGRVNKKEFKLDYYWEIQKENSQHEYSEYENIKSNVKELFFNAVERRMVSDVPLGAFLSGGIDSSAIVAAMSEVSKNQVSTFSIGFHEKEFDESSHAELIAKKFNTNHYNVKLSANDFLQQLPTILPSFDKPSGDGANTYIVSELVKNQGITVALSGLGGDELFAGYDAFKRYYKANKYSWVWNLPSAIKSNGVKLLRKKLNENQYHRLVDIMNEPKFSFPNIYPYSRRLLSVSRIKSILKLDNKITELDRLKENFKERALSMTHKGPFTEVSIGEISGYTQNVLLMDSDQMSMAHALEVRVPFFDHELVEYTLGIPDKYKYPKFPKKLLVDSIYPLLPDEIVHRKKMGFSFPWDNWLRNDLKSFCQENLNYLKNLSQFNSTGLEKFWDLFLNNSSSVLWSHIWILSSLGAWLKENDIK